MKNPHKNENSAFFKSLYLNETTETLLKNSLLAVPVGSYLSKKFYSKCFPPGLLL